MWRSYIRFVLQRSIKNAWHTMIARDVPDLIGKALGAGLILFLLWWASDSPTGKQAFGDEWSIAITGMKALVIGFAILFFGNLLFVAPYQLWRERVDADKQSNIPGEIINALEKARENGAFDANQFRTDIDRLTDPNREFYEAFESLTAERSEAPPSPISLSSLGAYVRGRPTARRISKAIAETNNIPFDDKAETASVADVEKATAFGIVTVAELDALMKENEKLIVRMAAYFIPERVGRDFSIMCLFFVLGGKMGGEAYYNLVKDLKYSSHSLGLCNETAQDYLEITAY